MKIAEIQFTPLSKTYWFNPENHNFKINDQVIVKTDLGTEIGKIINFKEINEADSENEIKPIIRRANKADLDKITERLKNKNHDLEICHQVITTHQLDMKIIDLYYSFDGGRLTIYFTAEGRVDFRQLVKDLTHTFQKSIRLYQIGVRDEARSLGEIGSCGKKLCCKTFLSGKINQISSNYSVSQQIAHRGNERLTGVCGRLKCCLKFEQELYEELSKKLPAIGSTINTPQGKGKVLSWQVLKQTVEVELIKDQSIITVSIDNK
ncbi:MAG TPA: regulatory iron-sulfur-containing complex subunit RicT [bacterium]|nr:regulatory iron-sulfur-containing complex subunit RicT [bacterium]HPL95338.1 regulatory iron-sulfur-containing complex subunit RicT [bacterium]